VLECTPEECHLPVDSEDAIGQSSKAFNTLVDTLGSSLQLEMQMRTYTSMLASYLDTKQLCRHALHNAVTPNQGQQLSVDRSLYTVKESGRNRVVV